MFDVKLSDYSFILNCLKTIQSGGVHIHSQRGAKPLVVKKKKAGHPNLIFKGALTPPCH